MKNSKSDPNTAKKLFISIKMVRKIVNRKEWKITTKIISLRLLLSKILYFLKKKSVERTLFLFIFGKKKIDGKF